MTYLIEITYSTGKSIKVRATFYKVEIGHLIIEFGEDEFSLVPFHNVLSIDIQEEDDE